jgi:hypothetical protein
MHVRNVGWPFSGNWVALGSKFELAQQWQNPFHKLLLPDSLLSSPQVIYFQ